jgi:ribosome-associated heat shock protein Hsp15
MAPVRGAGASDEPGGEDTGQPAHAARPADPEDLRLDKWLWAARFYKTRSLAAQAIEAGRVQVNGARAKATRSLRPGDQVLIRQPPVSRTVQVLGLSKVRGPAPAAQQLYAETPESLQARLQAAQARRFGFEPALSQEQGRPTKRDRRSLVEWERWSASLEPEE